MSGLRPILSALSREGARFVVIGGVALSLQGSSYITEDIDLAYERTRENSKRVASALRQFSPRPRGFPEGVPFVFDDQTLMSSEVLTLSTTVGDLDLLASVKGIGNYAEVEAASDTVQYGDLRVKILSVEALIRAKRAAGRPKDQPGLIELEAIRQTRMHAQREGTPRE